jgi:hypothetical protein
VQPARTLLLLVAIPRLLRTVIHPDPAVPRFRQSSAADAAGRRG